MLKPGGETLVRFGNDQKSVIWDFNIIDAQGLAVRFDKVNLLNVQTITLKEKDGKSPRRSSNPRAMKRTAAAAILLGVPCLFGCAGS